MPEYWVVDLKTRSTVVHRAPKKGKYTSVRRAPWASALTSDALGLTVKLSDVLG